MNNKYKSYAITYGKNKDYVMIFQCFDKKIEKMFLNQLKKNKQLHINEVSYEEK